MNFRVILLLILVLIFTLSGIYLSLLSFEATSLKESFNKGEVEIIQNTTAGTIPHVILVKNNGKRPIMVEMGQILASNTSQDLVVAEDKRVNQNSSSYIRAYCFQPNQTASPGTKLSPTDKASNEVKQLITNSNLADAQNTTRTQLQIWIIVSRNNIDLNSGEASLLTQNQSINNTEITTQLNEARTDLIKNLNLTDEELKNIKPESAIGSDDIIGWINEFINWIRTSFNIS
jgi:ARG and Rhodanese-Phosphatase-superfamily-associated Protein domain